LAFHGETQSTGASVVRFDSDPDELAMLSRAASLTEAPTGAGRAYSNNKLTPAEGFTVPEEHTKKHDIPPRSVRDA
jgi:hypothetical protein